MAHYLSLCRLLDVEIPIKACWMKYSQEMIACAGPKFDVQQTAREIQAIIEDPQFWAEVKKCVLSHIMMSHGLHESWQGRCRESFRFHGQPASADVGDSYYFLGSADVGRKRRRMSDISLYIRIRRLLPYFGDDE